MSSDPAPHLAEQPWADYAEYDLEAVGRQQGEFTINIDGTDFEAYSLTAAGEELSADLKPMFMDSVEVL